MPPVVYESFLSLSPLFFLAVMGFLAHPVRLGRYQRHCPEGFRNRRCLPGTHCPKLLVYAFPVTLLWSVGINGDNGPWDAIVAPIFYQFLDAKCRGVMAPTPAVALRDGFFYMVFHQLRQCRRDGSDTRAG